MNKGQQHWYAACLIALHLLLATAYSVIVPLGEAPDETDHWSYVVYLAEHKALPIGPKPTQSKHPPFYHIGAALAALPANPTFGFLRANPDIKIPPDPDIANFFIHTTQESWPWQGGALAFHLARFWSVLLSTATVAALYGLMQTAFPTQGPWVLVATGLLALIPEFSFIGGVLNNDNAAAFFGTLGLWGALAIYRQHGKLSAGWWLPIALGCGLLSKVSTLALWPTAALAIVLGAFADPDRHHASPTQPWWRAIRTGLITFGGATLLAAPWLWRNWQLYGDPTGMALTRQTIDLRLDPWTWADTTWLLRGWFLSFWGKFGVIGHLTLPHSVYWGLAFLTVISGVGLIKLYWRPPDVQVRSIMWLMTLTVVTTIALMWQYSLIALGTDQGRLLYPAIAPLIALFAGGLLVWLPARVKWLGVHLLLGGFLILALYALIGVVRPAFAPPTPASPIELAAPETIEPVGSIAFGALDLHGWQLTEDPTLYWQATRPIATDLRVVVRVVAADGTLVWDWKRSPGGGEQSTDHWPPGVIMRDTYEIRWPDWVQAGRYQVEVGVQPFGEDFLLPEYNHQAAEDAHPFVSLGWLEYTP